MVIRNDVFDFTQEEHYDGIVLSPGPGLPAESGRLMKIIERFNAKIPMLGICLGMQGIVEHFGGRLENMKEVLHGRKTRIKITEMDPLFEGIPDEFGVGRYHSWCAEQKTLPGVFKVLAVDLDGIIMAIKHKEFPTYGLQFHPESILTESGLQIIQNWIKLL